MLTRFKLLPDAGPTSRSGLIVMPLLMLVLASGCTGLRPRSGPGLASLLGTKKEPPQVGKPLPAGSTAQAVYQATRQAKANGGIVLQVVGDETPLRVLPLPGEGQSVYVSQLLRQSGVTERLGAVEATLFRHATGTIGGLPMLCKMDKGSQEVLPESDYALRPGDRLRVEKTKLLGGADLIDLVLQR